MVLVVYYHFQNLNCSAKGPGAVSRFFFSGGAEQLIKGLLRQMPHHATVLKNAVTEDIFLLLRLRAAALQYFPD